MPDTRPETGGAQEGEQGQREDETTVFMFDNTHSSMEAEDLIVDAGIWCDVVPRPPATMTSLCGLAIEVLKKDAVEVKSLLKSAGIAFEIYRPEVEAH